MMERIIDVADYLATQYNEIAHEPIDEMKLQKLLYFTQRETIAILGKTAFHGDFEGWKFGPVSRIVRNDFQNGEILVETYQISQEIQYIVINIILQYGSLASWKLSELSHKERSWLNAREGLAPNENGSKVLDIADIIEDAKKVRPYDSMWDMYYDEFEDEEAPASEADGVAK